MNRIEKRKKFRKERRRKRILKREERKKYKEFDKYVEWRTDMFIEAWMLHFGHTGLKPFEGAKCEDCMDYQSGVCKGGRVPEECMKGSVLL